MVLFHRLDVQGAELLCGHLVTLRNSCFALVFTGAFVPWACQNTASPHGTDGSGGGGGGCPTDPQALYTLHVRADGGTVPPDTTITATWSAAVEPKFVLSDKTTW